MRSKSLAPRWAMGRKKADATMTEQIPLFDISALKRARARAASRGFAGFLHAHIAAEVEERLSEVNRSFTSRALVTAFPQDWVEIGADQVVPPDDVLALTPESCDLVVHGLALHTANDPVGQLIQMRRALKADGMALAVLFGGRSLFQLRDALTRAEAEVSGGLSPRLAPMAEIRDLGGLLQRAGFALPVADSMELTITYPDLGALVRDLRSMGETNVLSARPKSFARRALFERTQAIYRADYGDAEGRLPVQVDAIFLTGWVPDASQQKPLKPGSAQMRLADVLKTDEMPD